MVRAVATDDPQTAPNSAEAKMEAIDSEPRAPRSATWLARKRSADSPETAATAPISVKRGTTEKV